MNRDKVRATFLELIKPFVRTDDFQSVNDSSLLVDDLKVNSTRFVDIVLEAEDKFKIRVDDDDMHRFERVGDAVDFICEKAVAA
jgi:acyl carrier protein